MTPVQQEAIAQMVAVGMTKMDIAKQMGIDVSTVYRIMKRRDPKQMKEERREAMERIASKLSGLVERTLETLEPPDDASYMQRQTGMGIMTDKLAVVDRRLQEHEDREVGAGAFGVAIPGSIEALVGAIRNDLRGCGLLTLLQVRLDKDGDTLGESVQKLEEQMGLKLVEAEVTKIGDLDVCE